MNLKDWTDTFRAALTTYQLELSVEGVSVLPSLKGRGHVPRCTISNSQATKAAKNVLIKGVLYDTVSTRNSIRTVYPVQLIEIIERRTGLELVGNTDV